MITVLIEAILVVASPDVEVRMSRRVSGGAAALQVLQQLSAAATRSIASSTPVVALLGVARLVVAVFVKALLVVALTVLASDAGVAQPAVQCQLVDSGGGQAAAKSQRLGVTLLRHGK